MSVQFIIGRSGTGKTSHCIKGIVDCLLDDDGGEQPLIFLVPEQASYQAERAILADTRIYGYHRLHVLSFNRLGFLLGGRRAKVPFASQTARQMIIHKVLLDKKKQLKLFGPSVGSTGLAEQMARVISELIEYANTPQNIEKIVEKMRKDDKNMLNSVKFSDISLIFREYFGVIDGKFADPDMLLTSAKQAVSSAAFVKNAKLWVDGFSGFTGCEMQILVELLKTAKSSQIALCMDPANVNLQKTPDPASLFNPTEKTYAELVGIIKKCKLDLKKPRVLSKPLRFSDNKPLCHIERNLFNTSAGKITAEDKVRIVSAGNARDEIKFIATEIVKLVKEKNYRYHDIAVVASDIDSYQHYITAQFDDYGIPFFLDKIKPLNRHPAAQLILSAMKTITDGFAQSDIFSYLKTDLTAVSRCQIDELENYCLAFGIREGDWLSGKDWQYTTKNDSFDEQRINEIRRKVAGPLLKLRKNLVDENGRPVEIASREFTQIIFDFLDELNIREKIGNWIDSAVQSADFQTADEHQQFFSKFAELFDELVNAFADRRMNCSDYSAIINAALAQLKTAFIPPTIDQVLVGSIERSRHPDLKAIFLTGTTQRQFPVPVSYDGLLTDDDRCVGGQAGIELAQTALQMPEQRQYLAYIAFTRPSELLYITYPSIDSKGSAVVRSQFVDEIKTLFDDLSETTTSRQRRCIENAVNDNELTQLLCSRLGNAPASDDTDDGADPKDILDALGSDDSLKHIYTAVRSAISYDNNAQLGTAVTEKLFGKDLKSSASGLSVFAHCPYQYFARHILKLKERKELKFELPDLGQFYHNCLDAWLRQIKKTKKTFAQTKEELLLQILDEQIQYIIENDRFIANFAAASHHNRFIIFAASERLRQCASAVIEMVKAGSFEPAASEVTFGEKTDELGEYKLALSGDRTLYLRGKIDRIDIAETDGEKTAVVFDYKRSGKRFDWTKFFHGLDMQLPIYIQAVKNKQNRKYRVQNVAAAFYMPVEVSAKKSSFSELQKKTDAFTHKARGIFDGRFHHLLDCKTAQGYNRYYNFYITKEGDQYGMFSNSGVLGQEEFDNVLRFAKQKIRQLAEELLSGKIDIKPSKLSSETACQWCKYKPLCRFNWQTNDYNRLQTVKKKSVLERIVTVHGKGTTNGH